MNQSEILIFSCTYIYNHHLKRFNFSRQKQRLKETSQCTRKVTNIKMTVQTPLTRSLTFATPSPPTNLFRFQALTLFITLKG